MGLAPATCRRTYLADVLLAQLQHSQVTQERRQRIWTFYRERLTPEVGRFGIVLQEIPNSATHPAHVFALLLPPNVPRPPLLSSLREQGITVVSHYEPLHSAGVSDASVPLPVTDDVAQRLVRLPLHAALAMEEADRVIVALVTALEKRW